jgi:hypothetical protein
MFDSVTFFAVLFNSYYFFFLSSIRLEYATFCLGGRMSGLLSGLTIFLLVSIQELISHATINLAGVIWSPKAEYYFLPLEP